jgi:hypothetical protein
MAWNWLLQRLEGDWGEFLFHFIRHPGCPYLDIHSSQSRHLAHECDNTFVLLEVPELLVYGINNTVSAHVPKINKQPYPGQLSGVLQQTSNQPTVNNPEKGVMEKQYFME